MLKVMATTVLRKIASDLQGTEFFTIMIDECTDAANLEQVYNIKCLTHKMYYQTVPFAGGVSLKMGI